MAFSFGLAILAAQVANVPAAGSPTAVAPITTSPASLNGLATEVVSLDDHGTERRCEGPSLAAVLDRAGFPQGKTLRGEALGHGVEVVAADGYAVLLSLGEIDPLLGNARAILATRCDGVALDATTGPVRLIVEGDGRSARAVRQVVRIVPVDPASR